VSSIIKYKYLKTEKLSKNDVVICCGVARDVGRNETKEGLKKVSELIRLLTNTNVIVTCIPHRFDLQAESCVNKEVEQFNRKLQKKMKTFEHVKICNTSANRGHFTNMVFTCLIMEKLGSQQIGLQLS
jgi:endonuclease IV